MITCKIYSAAFKYTVLLTVITTVCITSPELHYMQGTVRAKKIGVLKKSRASLVAQLVKNPAAMQEIKSNSPISISAQIRV